MPVLAQTIQVINQSGKVVNTSRSLKNVFDEAKAAYKERKAEIKAERQRKEDIELQKAIECVSIQDQTERGSVTSRHPRQHRRDGRLNADDTDRGAGNDRTRRSNNSRAQLTPGPHSSLEHTQMSRDLYGQNGQVISPSEAHSPYLPASHQVPAHLNAQNSSSNQQLLRRAQTEQFSGDRRPSQPRSYSHSDVDLDLAYGEFHAPDLHPPPPPSYSSPNSPNSPNSPRSPGFDHQSTELQKKELNGLVKKCQGLLVEADCAFASSKAIFSHLQANPDSMAAVALTLAEISNIAARVGPGALAAFKTSAPGVLALLAAPEFLIAVGVGVGVTIVMFGGYKIIKKITAAKRSKSEEDMGLAWDSGDGFGMQGAAQQPGRPKGFGQNLGVPRGEGDELLDVRELDRIEKWRRGIADMSELEPPQPNRPMPALGQHDDGRSVVSGYSGTSVEGEFITPYAQRSMGHLPLSNRSIRTSAGRREEYNQERPRERRKHRKRREGDSRSEASSQTSSASRRDKAVVKVKKPSPLRRMFATASR